MAPSLIASYYAEQNTTGSATLTTSSFTPSNGEVVIVKLSTWDGSVTMGAPTGGSQTYTSRLSVNSGVSFSPYCEIYTAVISGSPGAMTISSAPTGSARYSMVVERWGSAQLAGSPVTASNTGTSGAPSSSLTTTAANSVLSWVSSTSWFGPTDPLTAKVYINSATEDGYRNGYSGANGVEFYAYQAAASAGAQSFGLSAPTDNTGRWAIAGVEVKDAGGGASGAIEAPTTAPVAATAARTVAAAPIVLRSRGVTALQASSNPAEPTIPAAGRPTVMAAPGAVLVRAAASPAASGPLPLVADPVLVFTPPGVAVRPLLLGSRDVTPLVASDSPARAPIVRPGTPPALAAPAAVVARSTAAPVVTADTPTVPDISRVMLPAASAPAPVVVRAPGYDEPPALAELTLGAAPGVTRTAPAAWLTRSTADPVVSVDAPTAADVARVALAPALAAPAAVVTASRDVTPPLSSSNPAAPLVAAAGIAPPVPARITLTRSTADPVLDSTPRPLVAPVGIAAPQSAPLSVLAVVRDVTALQASSNPAEPLVAPAGIPAPQSAPPSLLARSTADPIPLDYPHPPVVPTVVPPAYAAPPARVARSTSEPDPVPWPALVVPAPLSPKAAAVAAVSRLFSTDPVVPPRQNVATVGVWPGRAAAAVLVLAKYGAPPVPNVAGRLTGSTSTALLTGSATGLILTGGAT